MSPTFGASLPDEFVHEWSCPDCGTHVRIRHDNAVRLMRAAEFVYATCNLEINIRALPAVDWTADVPDDVIAQGALAAFRPGRA